MMKPKAKFLTAVWGEIYITRFATLALPSFLAPGNLPAFSASTDMEVVILTRRADFESFDTFPAVRSLRSTCAVRFVEIDDLITTGVYGVTLTLAYARAVIACGQEMLNTHFVFMNADFVLADGSLRSLLKHIYAGRSIVLAPSFRAIADALEPKLRRAVNGVSPVLAVPPRQLTSLALAHPHPTTVAKIVNQRLCHSTQPNQFFWRVDHQTMLGRYYLIFMLCLKPERIIRTINSYCDYSFVPEMCPSGDEVVMGDSDEFFMLELQRRTQETHMLRAGTQSDKRAARSLSEWTTPEHRRASQYDLIFHGGDCPPELDQAKKQAHAYIREITKMLGPPTSHVGHRHWIGGIKSFRTLRIEQGLPPDPPPELDTTKEALWGRTVGVRVRHRASALLQWLVSTLRISILGRMPLVTALHPCWLDYLHLRQILESSLSRPGGRMLVVREEPELVDALLVQYEGLRVATSQEVFAGLIGEQEDYVGVLIYLGKRTGLARRDIRMARRVIKRCLAFLHGRENACYIFFHQPFAHVADDSFAAELTRHLEGIVEWPLQASVRSFVGGRAKRFTFQLFDRLRGHYVRFGTLALLWIPPLLATTALLTLLTNLLSVRRLTSPYYVDGWSSALFSIDRGTQSTASNEAAPANEKTTQRVSRALVNARRSTI